MKTWRVVLLSLLWPAAAHACAVCGASAADRNRAAFFGTTILLSLLPLGMIGGGLWWLRRGGGHDPDEFIDREAKGATPPVTSAIPFERPTPPDETQPLR